MVRWHLILLHSHAIMQLLTLSLSALTQWPHVRNPQCSARLCRLSQMKASSACKCWLHWCSPHKISFSQGACEKDNSWTTLFCSSHIACTSSWTAPWDLSSTTSRTVLQNSCCIWHTVHRLIKNSFPMQHHCCYTV